MVKEYRELDFKIYSKKDDLAYLVRKQIKSKDDWDKITEIQKSLNYLRNQRKNKIIQICKAIDSQ